MPRNLVICCDGTNNEFGSRNTNVVRLVQVLERDQTKQRLYYDPGVGTLPEPSAFTAAAKWISKIGGLAFGEGLTWKISEAYEWLMDTWEPGDQVFLFGFSRGAYSVRVLAALLHGIGLLPKGNNNLVPYAMRLFKAIANSPSKSKKKFNKNFVLCDKFRRTFARAIPDAPDEERRFPVHFIGVWDTVSSVGWVWEPAQYAYTRMNPSVKKVRHAVSIDERRIFFRQNLFKAAPGQDLVELWFPGVHSDVGGGYPQADSGLSRLAFQWMVTEAQTAGILVNPLRLDEVLNKFPRSARPWTDCQHESLKGVWWVPEFLPKPQWDAKLQRRKIGFGLGRYRYILDCALMSKATLLRIKDDKNYAPHNLTPEFLRMVRALQSIPEFLPFRRMDAQTCEEPTPTSQAPASTRAAGSTD